MLRVAYIRILAVSLWLAAAPAWAETPIPRPIRVSPGCPGATYQAIAAITQESAVELELPTTPAVLALLTTTDETGAVRPLLKNGKATPRLVAWVNKHASAFAEDPAAISWDLLPAPEKLALIKHATHGVDFYDDRQIHGLRVKPRVKLNFFRETEFMGVLYAPGWHEVETTGFLIPKVERAYTKSANRADGVELHFRAREAAGNLSNEARTFLGAVRAPRIHQHVHMVAPIPNLWQHPEYQSLRMADFVRRANLLAELIDVMQGSPIARKEDDGGIYFAYHTSEELDAIRGYFLDVAHGKNPAFGPTAKTGWIGFWGSDKYDRPGLYGLEFRAVSDDSDPKLIRRVLNGLQQRMLTQNFEDDESALASWQRSNQNKNISALWYHSEEKNLSRQAAHLPPKIANGLNTRLFQKLAKFSDSARLLAYDWASDPIFAKHPDGGVRVIQAQADAIRRINAGEHPGEVLAQFVRDSGLFRRVAGSLRMSEVADQLNVP